MNNQHTQDFYNKQYFEKGVNAQRQWPNEELCRFIGREYFHLPKTERTKIKVLEVGCGSGGNLWMLSYSGFDVYGIDLSEEGIKTCESVMREKGLIANLSAQDMCKMTFNDSSMDVIVDVFSSFCLAKAAHDQFLNEAHRILKPGGKFFSYFPSKQSDSYQNPGDAVFLDQDTLASIVNPQSPYCGQTYPFRFIHAQEYESILLKKGFKITYSESLIKTYNHQKEIFAFITIVGEKL